MRPKLKPRSKKAPARRSPGRDPRGAQTPSTPTRKDVRESVRLVRAPRQSQRPVGRTKKKS